MKVVWSTGALADLDRFAEFLTLKHPSLAAKVGAAILERTTLLAEFPGLGHPVPDRPAFRECVIRVLRASYVVRYRESNDAVVLVRVFHSREDRERSDA